jgi:predicted nucleotidyltransferase
MNSIIERNKEKIIELCEKYNVNQLFAFGSVCTDEFNDESDIDLLVEFNPMDFVKYSDNYFELSEMLEHLFNRKVDLLTINSLNNPYFIENIEKSKKLIYENKAEKILL